MGLGLIPLINTSTQYEDQNVVALKTKTLNQFSFENTKNKFLNTRSQNFEICTL